jgi:hypothetical protein
MTDKRTSYVAIWLHLLKEGGWHTGAEVFSVVKLEGKNQHHHLWEMVKAGYLQSRRRTDGSMEYGVTMTCKLPRFMNVGDIATALA